MVAVRKRLRSGHSVVKSQLRKLKGPGAFPHSRPASFQQRTNTSCHLAMPTRGFTAVVSVFGGTPPPKPLICKIRFAISGDVTGHSRAHHTGDDSKLVFAKFSLSPDDITRMSRCSCSQAIRLSLLSFVFQFRG